MFLRTIALAAAACVATALTAAPAAATEIVVAPETVTVRVSYADLNLATPAGRALLDRRIAGAARSICGNYDPAQLEMFTLVRTCRQEVIASARLPTAALADAGTRDLTVTGRRMSRAAN